MPCSQGEDYSSNFTTLVPIASLSKQSLETDLRSRFALTVMAFVRLILFVLSISVRHPTGCNFRCKAQRYDCMEHFYASCSFPSVAIAACKSLVCNIRIVKTHRHLGFQLAVARLCFERLPQAWMNLCRVFNLMPSLLCVSNYTMSEIMRSKLSHLCLMLSFLKDL